ncbi:MAG: NAD(P)-dependent oxidoreductase, partial [Propionibacteriaceae bacterium]
PYGQATNMSDTTGEAVGFIGVGVMGQPMALNLARSGVRLIVWNRTAERTEPLRQLGATVASEVDDVFAAAEIVLVMLINEEVTDRVLGRGTPAFAQRVAGHLIISTGSVAPEYSRSLAADIRAAGGRFVESPVSGSRGPAEAGTLVALPGGDPDDIEAALPLLEPMTKAIFPCGPSGNGLLMKLAVNTYLNITVAAIAESANFARAQGLDLTLFRDAILAGPMASEIIRSKLEQLVTDDYAVRAAITDVYASTRLIADVAEASNIPAPLLEVASDLYRETVQQGHGREDMVAVIKAIQARTADQRG